MTQEDLAALVDHLAAGPPAGGEETWRCWRITLLKGGANNAVYRAAGAAGEVVVKLTIRDGRDRAGREFAALSELQRRGLAIAPLPLLLQRDRQQPVVVQSWLPGTASAALPAGDEEWTALLEHFVALRGLGASLPRAVLTAGSAGEAGALVQAELGLLPQAARPPAVEALVGRLLSRGAPEWPPPPLGLCRGDPSPPNFIRRPGAWASVDWENSGQGDLAFEIGDLLAHPAYLDVPPARQRWLVDTYCGLAAEPAAGRIRVYQEAMLVYWTVRLSRLLHEVPRGLDARLVPRPAGWEAQARRDLQRYLERADACLRED